MRGIIGGEDVLFPKKNGSLVSMPSLCVLKSCKINQTSIQLGFDVVDFLLRLDYCDGRWLIGKDRRCSGDGEMLGAANLGLFTFNSTTT